MLKVQAICYYVNAWMLFIGLYENGAHSGENNAKETKIFLLLKMLVIFSYISRCNDIDANVFHGRNIHGLFLI